MTGTGPTPTPARVPTSVRAVGIVLAVAGAMYLILGLFAVSTTERSGALLAMGSIVLGAACLLLGWKLATGARWAYLGAAIVLGLAVVAGIVTAITSSDRSVLAQVFVPAVGLYLLARRESRDHFMV